MSKALEIKNTDHIAVTISSLYGEFIITTTEVLLGIGLLNSTDLFSTYQWMPRHNRIWLLIGAGAFIATVPLKYKTGPPGTPHGVLIQLGWSVTGPLPQKYQPFSNKKITIFNITLYSRKKPWKRNRERHVPIVLDNWGKILVSGKKTLTADDRKALGTLKKTTCGNDSHYEIGQPWRHHTKLHNNYFLAKAQLQSLENRLQQEPDLLFRYKQISEADIKKGLVEATALTQFHEFTILVTPILPRWT